MVIGQIEQKRITGEAAGYQLFDCGIKLM